MAVSRSHRIFLALLALALVLWPLRHTSYVEMGALLLPLMAIGLVKALELDLFQRFVPRWILANALLFGVAVNAFAAFRYWQSWHRFPVHMLAELMGALKP
ncbi:hypothetical protein [Archangium violaceum]|uniref:Uncharacterized protein n=1 Tax=Archangium violaceum Cb vi76 TaxID=1406225 RepID=A0A084SHS4_9BACT|nr:hypothetical protein [Archangium violaceum]KFA88009.1 hypothetical protein Q664_43875 [Archangium violaceum Cb vi76]